MGWAVTAGLVLTIGSGCGHSAPHAANPTGPTSATSASTLPAAHATAAPPRLPPTTPSTAVATSVAPSTARPRPPKPVTTLAPGPSTSEACPGCAGSRPTPPGSIAIRATAWCPVQILDARAGPAEPFAGNGARIVVTVHATGTRPCLVPASVELRLTDAHGATEAEALSAPATTARLAIGPSTDAALSMTWVRQGCFSPTADAARGDIDWSGPSGPVEVNISGIAEDAVAPCHDAFGVTNLQ